ncbi:TetR family transcriptional regulator [Fodinicurvata sp. EGI_FJ10296]|uniref:TetR/AcrR family transcriptional regulator n=1 Tax=Fodinicurvata sp. EGI_FJ10296 TaxID=3231908 RepID=UPI00345139DB
MEQPAVSASAGAEPEKRDAATAILDAAEAIFADRGFDGASTRPIADRAGVNLALIHYYFGNKEKLFNAVFERRSDAINARRRSMIADLHAGGSGPTLEAVLDALLRPTIELGRDTARGGQFYARLVVHVASGTDDRSQRLTAAQYNDIARVFIAEIQAAVPGLSKTDAAWAYLNAIAVALSLMARTGRAAALSDGECRDDDVEDVMGRAIAFIAAGTRALAGRDPHKQPL